MVTLDQLGYAPVGLRRVSIKQLKLWASANGTPLYIYQIINGTGTGAGISADPASTENIQFYGSGDMVEGDALAVRIQAILGMTSPNWSLALSAMLDFPE